MSKGIYGAIDGEPAVTESEVGVKVVIGEYHKVSWEDVGRPVDGHSVRRARRHDRSCDDVGIR